MLFNYTERSILMDERDSLKKLGGGNKDQGILWFQYKISQKSLLELKAEKKLEGCINYIVVNEDNIEIMAEQYPTKPILIFQKNPSPKVVLEMLEQKNIKNPIICYDFVQEDVYEMTFDYFFEYESRFEKIYELCADEYSRTVLKAFLKTKLSNDYRYVMQTETWGQYVEKDIVDLSCAFNIVECGCYHGEDIKKLIEFIPKNYYSWLSLEADHDNYLVAKKNIKNWDMDKVLLYECAAWNREEYIYFDSDNVAGKTSCKISDSGKTKAKAVTIDGLIKKVFNVDYKCDYIKMDIEGAEYQALQGAETTIKKNKPILAISAYHRKDDIFRLAELITQFRDDYKIYFRNYCKFGIELVMYGV